VCCLNSLHLFSNCYPTGEDRVNTEVSSIFQGHSSSSIPSSSKPPDLLSRCNELLVKLRSDPAHFARKRVRKRSVSDSSKRKHDEPVTKRVIVLNYPGKKVPEVTPVYDHDILVDGFFTIESYDEEHHVRAKIQKMIERKQRYSFDFTSVSITDFDFVRVSNKKARVPDGSVPYDASAIAGVPAWCNLCSTEQKFQGKHIASWIGKLVTSYPDFPHQTFISCGMKSREDLEHGQILTYSVNVIV